MRFNRVLWGTCALMLFIITTSSIVRAQGCPAGSVQLWKSVSTPSHTLPYQGPEVIDFIAVDVNADVFRVVDLKPHSILLPGGVCPEVRGKKRTVYGKDGIVWQASINSKAGASARFAVVGDAVAGELVLDNGDTYRVRQWMGRLHLIEQLDVRKLPREGQPIGVSGTLPKGVLADACADTPDRIDLLVAYTRRALADALSHNSMHAHIYLAMEQLNQSLEDGGLVTRVWLKGVLEVGDPNTNAARWVLDGLRSNGTGGMDEVHTSRTFNAADMVALIDGNVLDECGRAYVPSPIGPNHQSNAFAVTSLRCATVGRSYGFVHELGHVLGSGHLYPPGAGTNEAGAFDFSYGFRGTGFKTLMVQDVVDPNSSRLLRWSDPTAQHMSQSMGDAHANNRETLTRTAPIVANFRCEDQGPNDVWMRDTWLDRGREPDPDQADMPMWKSPYIWARRVQDVDGVYQHAHQTPLFPLPAWLYVKLHNGGPAMTGELELYYAQASTGLAWGGSSWTPIGSRFISAPANATFVEEMQWNNIPHAGDFCLLARWASASDPMTHPEGSDIGINVRNNNNLIWRNINVVDLSTAATARKQVLVENPTGNSMRVNLGFSFDRREGRSSFLSFGDVDIEMDADLQTQWKRSGNLMRGFKPSGQGLRMLTESNSVLEDVELPPKFSAKMWISVARPKDGHYPQGNYTLDVVQTQISNGKPGVFGGVSYEINTGAPRDSD